MANLFTSSASGADPIGIETVAARARGRSRTTRARGVERLSTQGLKSGAAKQCPEPGVEVTQSGLARACPWLPQTQRDAAEVGEASCVRGVRRRRSWSRPSRARCASSAAGRKAVHPLVKHWPRIPSGQRFRATAGGPSRTASATGRRRRRSGSGRWRDRRRASRGLSGFDTGTGSACARRTSRCGLRQRALAALLSSRSPSSDHGALVRVHWCTRPAPRASAPARWEAAVRRIGERGRPSHEGTEALPQRIEPFLGEAGADRRTAAPSRQMPSSSGAERLCPAGSV